MAIHSAQPSPAYQTLYTYMPTQTTRRIPTQRQPTDPPHRWSIHTYPTHLKTHSERQRLGAAATRRRVGPTRSLRMAAGRLHPRRARPRARPTHSTAPPPTRPPRPRARQHPRDTSWPIQTRQSPGEDANIDWLVLGQRIDVETLPESNAQHFQFHSELLLAPANQTSSPTAPSPNHAPVAKAATWSVRASKKSGPTAMDGLKVRFHWHRNDPADETSTCWVPERPLGGQRIRQQPIPRIG